MIALALCSHSLSAQHPAPPQFASAGAIVQDISLGTATLTRAEDRSHTELAAGELLYPGDMVEGELVLIAECRGNGSRIFVIQSGMVYVAGQQSGSGRPIPDCQLPQVDTSSTAQHIVANTLHDAPLDKRARQDDVDQAVVQNVSRELTPAQRSDKLYLLRLAVALEQKNQLSAAIIAYDDLQKLWPNAAWILPKQNELKVALRAKLLKVAGSGVTKGAAPLVIGISSYKDSAVPPLHYAHFDAQSFATYLNRLDGPLKDEPLINADASKAKIVSALALLRARTLNGGTAVVFISGHGFQGTVDSYIAPYDSYWKEVSSSAIPVTDILAALKGATEAYLFVDACRDEAEEKVHETFQKLADNSVARIANRASASRIFIFLSTGPGKTSAESDHFRDPASGIPEKGHGAFTFYLLKALYSQTGQPHAITRNELVTTVTHAMEALRPQQRPRDGGNFLDDDLLDPLRVLPVSPVSDRTLAPTLRGGTQLINVAYAVQDQARRELTEDLALRLNRDLSPVAITPDSARDAVAIYESLGERDAQRVENPLRVAIEDAGQRLLLHYLDGDEVEQTAQEFKDAATYYKLAKVLTPESPFLSARMAFNSGRARLFDIVSAYRSEDRKKVFDSATAQLLQAYRADPGPYVINALGIAYMEQAQWDRAIPAFQDAIRRAPSWPYPKHNLALSLMRTGKARDAIAVYQDAIQKGPDRSYLHFNLALIYQQLNQLSKAQQEYSRAREQLWNTAGGQVESMARLYNAEGTLAAQRNDTKHARLLYDAALVLMPGMKEAVHNLALLQAPVEKEKLFRQNIAATNYLNSRIELAALLERQHRTDEAIAEYETIVRERPDFAAADIGLARLYLAKASSDKKYLQPALDRIAEAQHVDANFWRLHLAKAEAARVQGLHADAGREYAEARKRAPDRDARREVSQSEKNR